MKVIYCLLMLFICLHSVAQRKEDGWLSPKFTERLDTLEATIFMHNKGWYYPYSHPVILVTRGFVVVRKIEYPYPESKTLKYLDYKKRIIEDSLVWDFKTKQQ